MRPSDILIERFSAWKRLVKNLITYFEGIADIEVSPVTPLVYPLLPPLAVSAFPFGDSH